MKLPLNETYNVSPVRPLVSLLVALVSLYSEGRGNPVKEEDKEENDERANYLPLFKDNKGRQNNK